MTDKLFDVLGLGVSTIDDLLQVDHLPRANEKQQILGNIRQCGGLSGSALVAAARLGCNCGYLIRLGEGELSSFLRRKLSSEGITLLESGDCPEAEPYHSIIVTERSTGERTIMWDNSLARPPRIGPDELKLATRVGCLFVDHVYASHIIDLVREARRAGTPVVGDFERTTPCSPELMDLTDHIILPLGYTRQVLGESVEPESAVVTLAKVPGRSLACVTDGTRGAWYALGEAPEQILHQSAFPVKCVVDSTGCGDVFHGAYVAGLMKGWPPAERVRYAAAAAAFKTRKPGAQAGAPNMNELCAYMAGK